MLGMARSLAPRRSNPSRPNNPIHPQLPALDFALLVSEMPLSRGVSPAAVVALVSGLAELPASLDALLLDAASPDIAPELGLDVVSVLLLPLWLGVALDPADDGDDCDASLPFPCDVLLAVAALGCLWLAVLPVPDVWAAAMPVPSSRVAVNK